jgi:hypothetical protein
MIIFYEQGENFWQYFNRNTIFTTAKELNQFLQNLDSARFFPKATINKIFEMQEKKEKNNFFINSSTKKRRQAELVFTALQTLGLIGKKENNFWKIIFDENPQKNNVTSNKCISMDSPNSFIVFPEIGFADAIKLARFSSVLETGITTRFALTKDSVVRAYRIGITCEEIITTLKNLSGTNVDQNIIWQLKDWEKRYTEVALYSGIVLNLSQDRLYLANTEPLASMISAILAPGIFLLNIDDEDDAAEALEKAGVDIIARNPIQKKSENLGSEKKQLFFPSLESSLNHQVFHENENNYQSDIITDDEKSDDQKDHFRTILAKMKITKDQRDELSARIERCLILTEEQMDGSSVKYEKLEARGLDYVGKNNIAKQAIAIGALIEVHWSDDSGSMQKIIGIPASIEKTDGEAVLVINNKKNKMNQNDKIRIVLGRISLLRRIKQSIFGE